MKNHTQIKFVGKDSYTSKDGTSNFVVGLFIQYFWRNYWNVWKFLLTCCNFYLENYQKLHISENIVSSIYQTVLQIAFNFYCRNSAILV